MGSAIRTTSAGGGSAGEAPGADPEPTGWLVDEFWSVVDRHPRRTAVIDGARDFTYTELGDIVRNAAALLGSRPGTVVVPATHSVDTIASLLAIWTVGGTYCPVDPEFPPERQAAMGSVAAEYADSTEDGGGTAYLLFTSGSTGRPKPVATPHGAIQAVTSSLRELFELTPHDRVLQFASLNWDTCFEEILPALTVGAALVFDDAAYSGSFPRFLRMVEQRQISMLDLPTAFWHELVRHLAADRLDLPASVRIVVIGGEAASPTLLADWCRLDTAHIRLVNTYGCTETTLVTHAVDLHGPRAFRRDLNWSRDWSRADRVPIGRALAHVVEHVDQDSELHVGGPGVALGYPGLPDETQARFGTVDGSTDRYFRTGDLVTRTADGALELLGRRDDELKVRGIRVDPAEVEAHLLGCPGVTAAAVVGSDLAGQTALIAYVVPNTPAAASQLDATIRSHLSARVPRHLVPSRITIVAELVMTASGKLDRIGTHEQYRARGVREQER